MFEGAGAPLSAGTIAMAANSLGIDEPAIWSVMSVETKGCGFLPSRQPIILFERHIFSQRTGGQYDASDSDVSNPVPGGYGMNGAFQYQRLDKAMSLDKQAALESASWGLGQVMGFNASSVGFSDVFALVDAMRSGEDAQFQTMLSYIEKHKLGKSLQSKDWASFAKVYNGPNFQKNEYDTKLAAAYARYCHGPMPDMKVRSTQLFLSYLHYDVGAVDGWFGEHTQQALTKYQDYKGFAPTGQIDDATFVALQTDATSLNPH